jgi:hypothetical protein
MDISLSELSRTTGAEYIRRPLFPSIRWGAILAGVVVGISVQLAMTLLGIATGLAGQGGTATAALLWAGFDMLVAALVAGYISARMSGLKRRADGVLHGAVSWAVTTILFAAFATSGGGGLMSSVLNSAGSSGGSEMTGQALEQDPSLTMDAESLQRFQSAIRMGDRETAVVQLMMSANVDRERAERIVDQALSLTPNSANRGAGGAGMQRNSIDTAAWIVFAAVALALVCGIVGGAWGAAGSRRTDWSARRKKAAYVGAAGDSDGNEDPGSGITRG